MNDQNLLRTAKVSSVDYKTGMVSVVYNDKGQSVSAKMPLMNFGDEYYMPGIGSQVQVALLSNGSSRGIVMGNTWQKGNLPRESGEGIYRKDFSKTPGACTVRYNDGSGEYALQSGSILMQSINALKMAGADVSLDASGKIVIDTAKMVFNVPTMEITGGENAELEIMNGADISFLSGEKSVESTVKEIKTESVENCTVKAGTALNLEDAAFKTTLSKILERLEALDGDTSARK